MWLLIINPTSGGGRGERVGALVRKVLSAKQVDYRDISGTSYESARSNLSEVLEGMEIENVDGIIAVGGDGLVHCVVQEIATRSIPLLVIPAGTGNDFARSMNLPLNDPESILEYALAHPPVPIDAGYVNGEYFVAILSTGFDSVVNERANRMKRIRGQIKYTISLLIELPLFKARDYRFRIDGETSSSKAMLIAIGNGASYGGGMLVCPDARIDDGIFDVMILGPISKFEFLKVFPKVFTGAHINHPAVTIKRGREISIEASAVAYADGERIGPLPITASVKPGALKSWVL